LLVNLTSVITDVPETSNTKTGDMKDYNSHNIFHYLVLDLTLIILKTYIYILSVFHVIDIIKHQE